MVIFDVAILKLRDLGVLGRIFSQYASVEIRQKGKILDDANEDDFDNCGGGDFDDGVGECGEGPNAFGAQRNIGGSLCGTLRRRKRPFGDGGALSGVFAQRNAMHSGFD